MQKKSFDLPGDKWADGFVLVDPATGVAYGQGLTTPGLMPVDTLASVGVARQLAARAVCYYAPH